MKILDAIKKIFRIKIKDERGFEEREIEFVILENGFLFRNKYYPTLNKFIKDFKSSLEQRL